MAKVKIWHDKEGDYLEVTFEDAPATLEEIAEDVFERRTPDGGSSGLRSSISANTICKP